MVLCLKNGPVKCPKVSHIFQCLKMPIKCAYVIYGWPPKVYVNDDDVEPYVQEDFGDLNLWIKVKQHVENSEDCPCVENEQNVENFNDVPHHLKKKRSNECRTRSSSSFQPQPKRSRNSPEPIVHIEILPKKTSENGQLNIKVLHKILPKILPKNPSENGQLSSKVLPIILPKHSPENGKLNSKILPKVLTKILPKNLLENGQQVL